MIIFAAEVILKICQRTRADNEGKTMNFSGKMLDFERFYKTRHRTA